MQESPALPEVRGVRVSHETLAEAVQVPEPEVRMEPPPPSLVKVRVGGSMLTTAHAERVVNQRARRLRTRVLVRFFMAGRTELSFLVDGELEEPY